MNTKPKHILVIRLSAMGDVAMSVPVLSALIDQNPEVSVTVVSRPFFKPLFSNIPNVNFYGAHVNGEHKGVKGLFKLYKQLKELQPEAVADIHDVLRSKILGFFFSSSKLKGVKIDKGRAEKKALTRSKNKVFKQLKSTHERYADVFRKLGYNIDLSKPKFQPKSNLTPDILKIVPSNHLKWIGIAPFAQYKSKMYPIDLMEDVIKRLEKTEKYTFLLFGGGTHEVKLLDELASFSKNVISVAGKLKLEDELKLIANLDCMVSMDSANSHLAAMQGVKTITMWGVTHPFAGFAPFNQPEDYMILPDLIQYPKIPCSVYGNKVFEGYEDVMRSISPESVVEKINKIV